MDRTHLILIGGHPARNRKLADELAARGFEVTLSARSDALERDRAPALVLWDLEGGAEGPAQLERLREQRPELPLILLGAQPALAAALAAAQQTVCRVLIRGADVAEVESAIRQTLDQSSLRQRLRDVDQQLRRLIETAPIPYVITREIDGCILYANRHLAALLGLAPEDIVGRFSPEFYYDVRDRQALLDKLRAEGAVQDLEVRVKRADGRAIWTSFSFTRAELGGVPVLIGGLYDISRRKSAEEALTKERNFVSAILDTAGALVVVLDPEGRIVRFNRACEQITGYRFEETRGEPFWQRLLIAEERDEVLARFERLRAGQAPIHGSNFWLTKTGERRWIDWSNTALLGPDGRLEYVVAIGIDRTESRQAEEKRQLYHRIFQSSTDVITVLDLQGNILERNPAHERSSGFTDPEVLGQNATRFLSDPSAAAIADVLANQACFRGEAHAKRKDGSLVAIDLAVFPILDAQGQATCIVGMGHDISQLKRVLEDLAQANQDLRRAQAQLVQSEKMASLGMLVAGIAHEINTPVGSAGSMHDTLVRAFDKLKRHLEQRWPQEVAADLQLQELFALVQSANQVIESGTKRVAEIVRRLRSFARLDEAELKKVDLHEGLEDTLTLIHHEIKHHIRVVRDYGEIPPIACFPGRLNQVFLNLLINARQAIHDQGEIRITTSTEGHQVLIAIRDTGVGIDPQHLTKIFDPGFTTKGVGVGTGLGLSICYQIMQEHKGEIRVESQPGSGSCFTLVLPMNLEQLLGRS